jgi:glycogen synthase
LRVLVVSNLFPPVVVGGYEVECAGVVAHLRERHDVHVLTSARGARSVPPDATVVRELPWLRPEWRDALRAPRASVAAARIARRQAARLRPDLVYVWNGASIPQAAIRVLDDLGVPVAFRVCEHWFTRLYRGDQFMRHLTPGERGLRGAWARGARALNRRHRALRLDPHRVASASVSWVSDALRRMSPAPPAIDALYEEVLPPATPQVEHFAALEPAPDRQPLLLFASRLEPQKGPEVAVRALARLEREHGVRARLAMAGAAEGPAEREVRHVAVAEGVADRVEFHGRLEPERLRELVVRAHAWLMPSVWEDPAPTGCIEAALARVPIVASRVGGIPELVADGEDGLLFDAGDDAACAQAIAATLSDAEATAARVQRARERAEGRRFGPYLERTDAFLERAVAAHRERYPEASRDRTASV